MSLRYREVARCVLQGVELRIQKTDPHRDPWGNDSETLCAMGPSGHVLGWRRVVGADTWEQMIPERDRDWPELAQAVADAVGEPIAMGRRVLRRGGVLL